MATPKVLMVGSIHGKFEKAFQKISKLHSKQNFAFAIAVGDIFAPEPSEESEKELTSLLQNSIKVALPVYFTVGDHALPQSVQDKLESSGEVCSNLLYLGRKGTLKTAEDIRIVTLGGRQVQNEASLTQAIGKYDPLYLETEAKSLHGAHSADILLTNQWPQNITGKSQVPVPEVIVNTSSTQAITDLNLALRPRYHFSTSPASAWSREPFMHPSVEGRKLTSYVDLDAPAVTRFTSLGSVDTSNKEFMSAFTLDPSKPPSSDGAQQSCPLISSSIAPKRKRLNEQTSNGYSRYNHDNNNNSSSTHQRCNKSNKRCRSDPASCFMCMSNPDFNSTMVVSIAEESILTVLKGPLPLRSTTFAPHLTSSGHIMIIPMYHAADEPSHGHRSPQDLRTEFDEMTRYRHSLCKMMYSKGLGAVTWEVNRTGIRHLHWQLIASPLAPLASGLVEAAYKVAGEKANYPPFQPCDPNALIPSQRSDFFRVWLYNPDAATKTGPADAAARIADGAEEDNAPPHETSLFFPLPPTLRFNISFGREVMAGLLQLEHRSDWRAVESGGGSEEVDAAAFKVDYGAFDWAMA